MLSTLLLGYCCRHEETLAVLKFWRNAEPRRCRWHLLWVRWWCCLDKEWKKMKTEQLIDTARRCTKSVKQMTCFLDEDWWHFVCTKMAKAPLDGWHWHQRRCWEVPEGTSSTDLQSWLLPEQVLPISPRLCMVEKEIWKILEDYFGTVWVRARWMDDLYRFLCFDYVSNLFCKILEGLFLFWFLFDSTCFMHMVDSLIIFHLRVWVSWLATRFSVALWCNGDLLPSRLEA